MYCIKCGKETQESQVFCESCLQVMDAYPVKPDTAIQLPNRSQQAPTKKQRARKQAPSQEEQLAQLKSTCRRLFWICVALTLLWGLTIGMLIYNLRNPKLLPTPIGSYSSVLIHRV